jgi:phosphoglycerate kinase
MASIKSVAELTNLAGKTVLVRTDFNVETPRDSLRLEKSLHTIKYLLAQRAKVVIISHRGRPEGSVVHELSLRCVVPFLRRKASQSIFLFDHFNFDHIKAQIAASRPGSLFMLENIRFLSGEESVDSVEAKQLAKKLATLGDYYVNDAFAVTHHPAVSLTELPKLLPKYAGFLMLDEIKNLTKVMKKPAKPLIVIVGGGKAADKFSVIKNLHKKADKFLVGGVLANTFFREKGMDTGYSKIDVSIASSVHKMLNDKKIVLPLDWMTEKRGKICDVGPLAVKQFADLIKGSKTIIWNGPPGIFEDPECRSGTAAIAKAIIQSDAFSVVGGGETTQYLMQARLIDKFNFVSTGGGAMLAFLGGKKLPGIEALKG